VHAGRKSRDGSILSFYAILHGKPLHTFPAIAPKQKGRGKPDLPIRFNASASTSVVKGNKAVLMFRHIVSILLPPSAPSITWSRYLVNF
jgi:hypothetical protein